MADVRLGDNQEAVSTRNLPLSIKWSPCKLQAERIKPSA